MRQCAFERSCIFIFCLLSVSDRVTAASWDLIETNTKTNVTLESIHFVDPQRGYAVSFRDTIFVTDDGGNTWVESYKVEKKLAKFPELRDVFFVDRDHGWVVGDDNIILHTDTGSLAWFPQDSGLKPFVVRNRIGMSADMPKDLLSVFFINPKVGWAVGGFGSIINTEDGGYTWEIQKGSTRDNYYGVFFVDPDYGWIVGESGKILHTTTGGKGWFGFGGWDKQDSGVYFTLEDLFFVDRQTGWAVGGHSVLHTTDGGKTWHEQATFQETRALGSIYFVDRNTGWVGGVGPIQHTRDGGKTWIAQPIPISSVITMHCLDAQHCWAASGTQKILRYRSDP